MNAIPHWLATTTAAGSIAIAFCLTLVPILRRLLGAQAAQGVWIFPLILLLVSWRPSSPVGVLPPSSGTPAVVVTVSAPVATSPIGAGSEKAISQPAPIPWIFLGWSAGAGAFLVLMLIRAIKTAKLIRSGIDLTDNPRVREALDGLPRVARLRIRETLDLLSPAVCGIWRPVILLPPGWIVRAEIEELRWVLLHEIGHIRRGDLLWRWAFQLVRAVHWFNPLVWLADRVAKEDQEMACDEWVLGRRKGADPAHYGEVILQIASRTVTSRLAPPAVAGMAESRRGLVRRLRHLAGARPRGAIAILAALAGGAVVLLVLSPAKANTAPKKAEPSADGEAAKRPFVKIESKFVEITENAEASLVAAKAPGGNAILDEKEFDQFLRELDQKKGVDLVSAPTVTTRSNRRAIVRIVREFKYPTAFEPSPGNPSTLVPAKFETRNVGITLEVSPSVSPDGEITCELRPEVVNFLGFIDYGASKPAPASQVKDALEQALIPGDSTGAAIKQPVFETRNMEATVALRSGQTALFGGLVSTDKQMISEVIAAKPVEQEKEIKRTLYFMVTARLAEENGNPINATPPQDLPKLSERPVPVPKDKTAPSPSPASASDRDIPFGVAVEGKPGFITSPHAPYAGEVDVRGFPSGTEVKCPYTGKLFVVP